MDTPAIRLPRISSATSSSSSSGASDARETAGFSHRGIEDPDFSGKPNDDCIYTTGPEYQLLDDLEAADNKTRLTCAAAAYGLYPSPEGHLKAVGDWNTARIVARGAHVEHWLNGAKVVEYELWSPDWEAKVASTKFKAWPKIRPRQGGTYRAPGRSRGRAGVPQHSNS